MPAAKRARTDAGPIGQYPVKEKPKGMGEGKKVEAVEEEKFEFACGVGHESAGDCEKAEIERVHREVGMRYVLLFPFLYVRSFHWASMFGCLVF